MPGRCCAIWRTADRGDGVANANDIPGLCNEGERPWTLVAPPAKLRRYNGDAFPAPHRPGHIPRPGPAPDAGTTPRVNLNEQDCPVPLSAGTEFAQSAGSLWIAPDLVCWVQGAIGWIAIIPVDGA